MGAHILSFSGGRTSAMMLHRWLEAHGGLPADHHVVFCNTGKERPETLDFVAECGSTWGVHINWLEYRWEPGRHYYEVVGHNSASRAGEPFTMVIRARSFLPNTKNRFCSQELKIRTTSRWATRELGLKRWTSVIGLRADEPERVARMQARSETKKDRWTTIAPLSDDGITRWDVLKFWQRQPFGLRLHMTADGRTPDGNCDCCFMKRLSTVQGAIERDVSVADWWIEQEDWVSENTDFRGQGNRFRKDWPKYREIRDSVVRQEALPLGDEYSDKRLRREAGVCGERDAYDPCGCFET